VHNKSIETDAQVRPCASRTRLVCAPLISDVMREEVEALVALGRFPAEQGAVPEVVQRHERALHAIGGPVSDEEARDLVKVFGLDDYFGLAWSLLHLVETAPGWPLRDAIANASPLWAEELKMRCVRGGVW
jgi:hypothetical protein